MFGKKFTEDIHKTSNVVLGQFSLQGHWFNAYLNINLFNPFPHNDSF